MFGSPLSMSRGQAFGGPGAGQASGFRLNFSSVKSDAAPGFGPDFSRGISVSKSESYSWRSGPEGTFVSAPQRRTVVCAKPPGSAASCQSKSG